LSRLRGEASARNAPETFESAHEAPELADSLVVEAEVSDDVGATTAADELSI
jgi:hypothetical protein